MIAVFLAAIIICCNIVSVTATSGINIEPRYTHVSALSAGLNIDHVTGLASCTGKVIAKNTYPVKVVVRLQIYRNGVWNNIASWTNSGSLNAYASGSYVVNSGAQYRVHVTGCVYNSAGELLELVDTEKVVIYPAN